MKKQILLIIPFLILGYVTYGCSCIFQPMSVQGIMQSDLVFKGKIIKKEEVNEVPSTNADTKDSPFEAQYFKYTFAVKKIINGDINQREVIVYSATQGATCGVNYALGDVYYLNAYSYKGEFHTGLCSQNVKADRATKSYKKIMCDYRKSRKLKEWKNVEGQVTALGKVVKKKAEGPWVFYYADKSIKIEGDFVKGKRHGDWKYFYSELASEKLLSRIDDLQKSKIKNEKNIVYKIEHYDQGEKTKEEYLFKLEN